jgi:hypothetical protein
VPITLTTGEVRFRILAKDVPATLVHSGVERDRQAWPGDAGRVKLETAEKALAAAKVSYEAGKSTLSEYLSARLEKEVAEAEWRGDTNAILRANLQFAEAEYSQAERKYPFGQVTIGELDKARLAKEIAEARLAGDAEGIARAELHFAERELFRAEAMYKLGKATQLELEKARLARIRAEEELRKVALAAPKEGRQFTVEESALDRGEKGGGGAAATVFGPVIERVIATPDTDDQGLVFFDMETGKSFKPPFPLTFYSNQGPAFVELTPELKQWIKARDVDVLLHLGEKTWDLMTLEMQEDFGGQLNEWETISPEKVTGIFAKKDAEHLVRDEVPASSFGHEYPDEFGSFNAVWPPSSSSGLKMPFKAFRTRSNTMGVYQFRGLGNSTRRGVGIERRQGI